MTAHDFTPGAIYERRRYDWVRRWKDKLPSQQEDIAHLFADGETLAGALEAACRTTKGYPKAGAEYEAGRVALVNHYGDKG